MYISKTRSTSFHFTFVRHDQGRLVQTKDAEGAKRDDKACASRANFHDNRLLHNAGVYHLRLVPSHFRHFVEIQNELNGPGQTVAITNALHL